MLRSSPHPVAWHSRRVSLLVSLLALGPACARTTQRPSAQKVREILAKGGPFAEGSFYACLLNGYEQGLPLKQIQKDCETKLAIDDGKGFGPTTAGDLLGGFGRQSTYFDPAKVTAACHSGDARVAGGPDGHGRVIKNYLDGRSVDWGTHSWGGKGQCDSSGCYKGLTEEESSKQKKQAIDDADAAVEKYKEAKADAEANPKDAKKADDAAKAKKAAEEAVEKAGKDPNKTEKKTPAPAPSPNVSSSGPDATPCEEALQAAREILGECQRTAWRSGSCQALAAKMKHCADPSLILVDPDAGYVCGAKPDPEAIKNAVVERCRQLKRPVPGGPDPCVPPQVDGDGRFAKQGSPDYWCHSPLALVDPEAPDCLGTVTIQDFGPNIQEILVWGLNKLGGPIVFLPNRHPSPPPRPGPDPRPGPKP